MYNVSNWLAQNNKYINETVGLVILLVIVYIYLHTSVHSLYMHNNIKKEKKRNKIVNNFICWKI